MGFKSLSLQVIPWCFHMVRAMRQPELNGDNDDLPHNPRLPTSSLTRPVRVVGSDDKIRIYNRLVGAAEVMKENPCLLVCRSDSFFIGQQVPALAAGDQLQPGHSYFLFPSHFFHCSLFCHPRRLLRQQHQEATAPPAVRHSEDFDRDAPDPSLGRVLGSA